MKMLRVVLPIVLGVLAGILNLMVLRGSSAPLEVAVVNTDVKADAELTEEMVKAMPVRADKELFKSAVPYAERGLLLGRRVVRPLSTGEVLLYADVHKLDEEDIRTYLKPGESTMTLPVKPTRIAPGLRRGDAVGVLVATRPAGGGATSMVPTSGHSGRRMLGPFRLLSLGAAVDPYRSASLGEPRMVVIALTRQADGRLDPSITALDEAIASGTTPGNNIDSGILAVEYYQSADARR